VAPGNHAILKIFRLLLGRHESDLLEDTGGRRLLGHEPKLQMVGDPVHGPIIGDEGDAGKFKALAPDGIFHRVGKRLAGQHFLAHGRLIDEGGHDDGRLHKVLGQEMVIDVHVRVMNAGRIVERVLDELEGREADIVERAVVRAARVTQDGLGHAQIGEGLHPLLENRFDGGIALAIDAADAAAPVVKVEIAGDFGVFGLERHGRDIAEVLLDVGL